MESPTVVLRSAQRPPMPLHHVVSVTRSMKRGSEPPPMSIATLRSTHVSASGESPSTSSASSLAMSCK